MQQAEALIIPRLEEAGEAIHVRAQAAHQEEMVMANVVSRNLHAQYSHEALEVMALVQSNLDMKSQLHHAESRLRA